LRATLLSEALGYKTIELYEFIKKECEKKRLSPGINFVDMFEATIAI